jgi:hypothetical protein
MTYDLKESTQKILKYFVSCLLSCTHWGLSGVDVTLGGTSMSHKDLRFSACAVWNGMSSSCMGHTVSETK